MGSSELLGINRMFSLYDYSVVRQLYCQTIGLSDYWAVGLWGSRIIELIFIVILLSNSYDIFPNISFIKSTKDI